VSIRAEIKLTIALPNGYNQGADEDTLKYLLEKYDSIADIAAEEHLVRGTISIGNSYMDEKEFRKK
jgi:hypothetical protein